MSQLIVKKCFEIGYGSKVGFVLNIFGVWGFDALGSKRLHIVFKPFTQRKTKRDAVILRHFGKEANLQFCGLYKLFSSRCFYVFGIGVGKIGRASCRERV